MNRLNFHSPKFNTMKFIYLIILLALPAIIQAQVRDTTIKDTIPGLCMIVEDWELALVDVLPCFQLNTSCGIQYLVKPRARHTETIVIEDDIMINVPPGEVLIFWPEK